MAIHYITRVICKSGSLHDHYKLVQLYFANRPLGNIFARHNLWSRM